MPTRSTPSPAAWARPVHGAAGGYRHRPGRRHCLEQAGLRHLLARCDRGGSDRRRGDASDRRRQRCPAQGGLLGAPTAPTALGLTARWSASRPRSTRPCGPGVGRARRRRARGGLRPAVPTGDDETSALLYPHACWIGRRATRSWPRGSRSKARWFRWPPTATTVLQRRGRSMGRGCCVPSRSTCDDPTRSRWPTDRCGRHDLGRGDALVARRGRRRARVPALPR